MRKFAIAAAAAAALLSLSAQGAIAATAQQSKMATCNKEAAAQQLSGDARKAFMSNCLKATVASAKTEVKEAAQAKTGATQQNKMAACNKEASAKSLKGDERKAFMSSCLKGAATDAVKTKAAAKTTAAGTRLDKNGKPLTAQQMKMGECAKAAKGLKGDEYRAKVSACLKAK